LSVAEPQRNPWNVVSHTVPTQPSRVLLHLVAMAAYYCRTSENMLVFAARQAEYMPTSWRLEYDVQPDAHQESEARADTADFKLQEISKLLAFHYHETTEGAW
jgi:hypothetical protein